MIRSPISISVERYPIKIRSLSGVRCKFCDEVFPLSLPGKKQFFVSEDGKKRKVKRGRDEVGDLVYMCPVCQIREVTETVDERILIDFGYKKYSDAEIKRRLDKERLNTELSDFGRETWAGWKP